MKSDMHFYGVYAMARAAGVKDNSAKVIAYASQFVDDSLEDDIVLIEGERCIIPTMTSHKPLDYQNALPGDQWKVWVPFHFLPGNESDDGDFVERMVCRKNSKVAKTMVDHTVNSKNKDYWPHLIGVVAHVYADTFSHEGFVGFSHAWNKVKGDTIIPKPRKKSILRYIAAKFEQFKTRIASQAAELVPVGHGAVGTYPDRPYLEWEFEYESSIHGENKTVKRNNPHTFLEAAECLYSFFSRFVEASPTDKDPAGEKKWNNIASTVKLLIDLEGPKDSRIKKWKKALSEGVFSNSVTTLDKEIMYIAGNWNAQTLREHSGDIKDADQFKYIKAANHHREYVLKELLPQFDLVIE
jgi:hypothetical protein